MIDLSNKTYQNILDEALNRITEDIDKREVSLAKVSLRPFAYALANLYNSLDETQKNGFVLTAEGEALDYICLLKGILRKEPTYAIKKGKFNVNITAGTRFYTINNGNLIYATVDNAVPINQAKIKPIDYTTSTTPSRNETANYDSVGEMWTYNNRQINVIEAEPVADASNVGKFYLYDNKLYTIVVELEYYEANMQCETIGSIGNDYIGNLLPLESVEGLQEAKLGDIVIPATDTESDTSLRTRYLESLKSEAFGGNIASYREYVSDIGGVGAVQVYPHYNGGGTVKLTILDANYNLASQELVELVQNTICPAETGTNEPSPLGYGLAPIGARVDVATGTARNFDIKFDVKLEVGKTIEMIQQEAERICNEYMLEVRSNFGKALITNKVDYIVALYGSQLTARLLEIEGVLNISNLVFDDGEEATADVVLVEKSDLRADPPIDRQEVPFVSNVIITQEE